MAAGSWDIQEPENSYDDCVLLLTWLAPLDSEKLGSLPSEGSELDSGESNRIGHSRFYVSLAASVTHLFGPTTRTFPSKCYVRDFLF